MICWPAIIKFPDDPELSYVSDQSQWDSDVDLHAARYDEADCLIDAKGDVYRLTTAITGCVSPQRDGTVMSLEDILGLIKAHAAQNGSCCVAKLYAPTIQDAFRMLAALNEE